MNKALLLILAFTITGCATSNDYPNLNTLSEYEIPIQVDDQKQVENSKTLGIAFGGGGVRGFVHLGVIKALEESGIKADLVTGSSAGSIAASLYASGLPYSEIEAIVHDVSEYQLADIVISRKGVVNGQKLAKWINESVPQENLNQMPIPIGITATDLTHKESVLILDGNPGEAVQTSSSVPAAFVPVKNKGRLLVDGALLTVVPVNYARTMGADIVIGVDIHCDAEPDVKNSRRHVAINTLRMLTCKLSEPEMQSADVLIRPDFEPESEISFGDKDEAIEAGYQATIEKLPEILALIGSTNDHYIE
ncbi:patatin-like phospholipase family protein [Vibrio sp. ZSDE26]|uniref:Patatin-like phospholipase family protein n=1 Tax=Vibrio amylolyticus TaxID=2847292 RepID=A0A9X1XJ13_9VIBR|nr:patatin-like phospholipase family protein [Vibrio amylolyticus]MCK6262743.1 patatin-like phospholipase family protein [Vibrio amylolyticus]